MNRKFKKILSAVLAVVMIFCAIPVMSFAADSDDYCPYKVGDIIEFGSYPQSFVTDEEILKDLYALEDDWKSVDWILRNIVQRTQNKTYYARCIDVTYEDKKYRAVTTDDGDTIHFFKYEPIKWRVLDPSIGLLMSEYALDVEEFHTDTYYDELTSIGYMDPNFTEYVSYEKSTIRSWLNNVFDKTAFTDAEYDKIVDKIIDDTRIDKSYIPTSDELMNRDYGFVNYRGADPARVAYSSDYALVSYTRSWKALYGGSVDWLVNEHMNRYKGCVLCQDRGKLPTYMGVGYSYPIFIRPFIQIGELKTDRTHISGEWQTIKEPTYTENGKQCKYCKSCNELLESKVIPKLKTGLQSISLPYYELEIQHKNSATLKPTVDCEKNYALSFSSSDEEVLTVDENGEITTHGRGTATITCTATDEDGKTLTDTCEITVKYNFWQWIARIFLYIIGVNSRI